MNQPSKKEFDCIAIKREAQKQIYEETKDMTSQQQIKYFRNEVQKSRFREWWEQSNSFSGNRLNQAS
jgi:hypothetical protein